MCSTPWADHHAEQSVASAPRRFKPRLYAFCELYMMISLPALSIDNRRRPCIRHRVTPVTCASKRNMIRMRGAHLLRGVPCYASNATLHRLAAQTSIRTRKHLSRNVVKVRAAAAAAVPSAATSQQQQQQHSSSLWGRWLQWWAVQSPNPEEAGQRSDLKPLIANLWKLVSPDKGVLVSAAILLVSQRTVRRPA